MAGFAVKAADMAGPFRSPRTIKLRSWDTTTIGAIVETIAGEHGYTPKVSAELAGLAVPHLDQTEESDMVFLKRVEALDPGWRRSTMP